MKKNRKIKCLLNAGITIIIVLILITPGSIIAADYANKIDENIVDAENAQDQISDLEIMQNKKIDGSTSNGNRGRDVVTTLDKYVWDPGMKQWVEELDLTQTPILEDTIKFKIVIENSGECTSSHTYIYVIDDIPSGCRLEEPEASAHVEWSGGSADVSDSIILETPFWLQYKENSAYYIYYHDGQYDNEHADPLTPQPIIIEDRIFSWDFLIHHSFQPDSRLEIYYEVEPIAEYFIHITDIHWGKSGWSLEEKEGFTNWIKFVNGPWKANKLPNFVLVSGDVVEYGAGIGIGGPGDGLLGSFFSQPSNCIEGSKGDWKVLLLTEQGQRISVPILFCPGNHDFRYYGQIFLDGSTNGWTTFVNSNLYYMDSSVEPDYVRVFSLNSGFDVSWWESSLGAWGLPEGDGLYSYDLDNLEDDLQSLSGDYLKIIMLHHPYYNINGVGSPLDGAFLNNRDRFITICNNYNIDLVLWGHTHEPNSGIIPGTSTRYNDGGSLRDGNTIKKILLKSCGRCGRDFDDPLLISNPIYMTSMLSMEVGGRARADAYDESGNHTGLNETNMVEMEIPGSSCSVWTYINESLEFNGTVSEIFLDKKESKDYLFNIEALANDLINISVSISLQSDNLFGGDPNRNGKYIEALYENIQMYGGEVATIYANRSVVDFIMRIENFTTGEIRTVFPSDFEGDDVFFVDDDFASNPPADFENWAVSIQDGIDNVMENGSVFVYPGTYHENIEIDKPLHLIGYDRDIVIIDGEDNTVVKIKNSTVELFGFTIQNGGQCPVSAGIYIYPNCNNANICGNIIKNNHNGISLDSSSENKITDNIITENRRVWSVYPANGITLFHSHKNKIIGNEISNNGYFIKDTILSGDGINAVYSFGNTIAENSITGNDVEGIYFRQASNNIITKNSIISNNENGIQICDSSRNTISWNDINSNCNYGIHLLGGGLYINGNKINDNTIMQNGNYGIYIDEFVNNHIYHNNFINNYPPTGSTQVYDGGNNFWNETYQSGGGNYWDDHDYHDGFSGPEQNDPNSDGIVDRPDGGLNPYDIDDGDNNDWYPLIKQWPWEFLLEGTCWNLPDYNPVNNLTVEITNIDTGEKWQAETSDNFYSLALVPWYDVNVGERLQLIAKDDNTNYINVTDYEVTSGDIDAGHKYLLVFLDEYYLDLTDFPMYEAEDDNPTYTVNQLTGSAVAQMNLDYMWWNSSVEPEPPTWSENNGWNQSNLFNSGQENNSNTSLEYMDAIGMWHTIQTLDPEPYSEYGYNFGIYHDADVDYMLSRICLWIDYTAGIKPGHPEHVPGAVPTFGGYSNWMSIRGIHTNRSAYPLPSALDVFGFWVNDPYPSSLGGIGENTYKTSAEWTDNYYEPINVADDPYNGEYVAICEPPRPEEECDLTLVPSPEQWGPLDEPPGQRIGMSAFFLRQVNDDTVVKAAIDGVTDQLIPYDSDFEEVFKQSYAGRPMLVRNMREEKGDYYTVPFTSVPTTKPISRDTHEETEEEITLIVVLVDANDGHFKEASWVQEPVKYLLLSRTDALEIVFDELKEMGINPEDINMREIKTDLVYRNSIPYYPDWRVVISELGLEFFVGQDGSLN